MLTRVLIDAVLRIALWVVPAAVILVALTLGTEHAIGVLIGAFLALGSSLGLVWIVGQLLDPRAKTSKGVLFSALIGKLILVGALLWASLALWGISGLGIIIGIGGGVLCLVVGVNRGSSSPAGQTAMADAEAEIARDMAKDLEDKEKDSG